MTTGKSSYLQYLPPVLWRDEPDSPAFSLGRFLLNFEKVLTGLGDAVALPHNGHEHTSMEGALDELYKLFHPFKAQSNDPQWMAQWLAYLASWVGLKLLPGWTEHQKRKLIEDILDVYNLRGLKRGLFKYLEIYLVSDLKPRISIDVGEAVFRVPLERDEARQARVVVSGPPIVHPLSVVVDTTSPTYEDNIVVGDLGAADYLVPATLWRMRRNGELDYQVTGTGKVDYLPLYNGSALPHIVGVHPLVDGKPIFTPAAIVDDPNGFYGVADSGDEVSLAGASKILRVSKYPPHVPTSVTLAWAGPPMVKALDMAINPAGNYVVLDRGRFDVTLPPEGFCKILVINPAFAPASTPSGAIVGAALNVPTVIDPSALALHPDGDYLVADLADGRFGAGGPAGADGVTTAGTATFSAASATFLTSGVKAGDTLHIAAGSDAGGSPWTVLQVNSETELLVSIPGGAFVGGAGQTWNIYRRTEIYKVNNGTGATTSLLAGLPAGQPQPVFPTALYVEDAQHILILDYGVKARIGTAALVQAVSVWRLTIPPGTPALERVSQDLSYVWPSGMSKDMDGNLVIVDRGDATDEHDWRVAQNPHQFGLIIHFSQTAPLTWRTARAISDIIRAEKPADTFVTLKR